MFAPRIFWQLTIVVLGFLIFCSCSSKTSSKKKIAPTYPVPAPVFTLKPPFDCPKGTTYHEDLRVHGVGGYDGEGCARGRTRKAQGPFLGRKQGHTVFLNTGTWSTVQMHFVNDKAHGEYIEYSSWNGDNWVRGQYAKGQKVGRWEYWQWRPGYGESKYDTFLPEMGQRGSKLPRGPL